MAAIPCASRTLGVAALCVGSWVLAGQVATVVGAFGQAPAKPRAVAFTYAMDVRELPPGGGQVEVWVPLASSRAEQRILSREIRTSHPFTVGRDPRYGNEMAYIRLARPIPERLRVEVRYQALLPGELGANAESPPTPEALEREQVPQGLVIVDEEVLRRSERAAAGRSGPRAQARALYDDVIRRMTYDKTTPGWGRGDTRRACLLGKGNCTDFHSLFMSMARARGIPARFKIGVMIPSGASSGTIPGYHCWAEFYEEGSGWVPVDASEAWKHPEWTAFYFGGRDPDRFLISIGRDLELSPPQRAEPVNIFFYPHIELDGTVVSGSTTLELHFEELPQLQEGTT